MKFTRCDHCTIEIASDGLRFRLVAVDDDTVEVDLCSAKCLDVYVKSTWPAEVRPDFDATRALAASAKSDPEWTERDEYGRGLDTVASDADIVARVIGRGRPQIPNHGMGGADVVRKLDEHRDRLKAGS